MLCGKKVRLPLKVGELLSITLSQTLDFAISGNFRYMTSVDKTAQALQAVDDTECLTLFILPDYQSHREG